MAYIVISICSLSAMVCQAGEDQATAPAPLASEPTDGRGPTTRPQLPKLFLEAVPDGYRIDFDELGETSRDDATSDEDGSFDKAANRWQEFNVGEDTVASADVIYQPIHPPTESAARGPVSKKTPSTGPTRMIALVAAMLSLIGWVLIALRSAKRPQPAHPSSD